MAAAPGIGNFVQTLHELRLVESKQLDEIDRDLAARFPNPKDLARQLIQRGWLTPYQVNQIAQNRGKDLILGQYVLLDRIGEGGMGQVFKARHQGLGRVVALKLMRKDRLSSPELVRRFYREVRAAAQLDHANVVRAFDAGEVNGTHYMSMEYVEAVDLAQRVKKIGPLPIADACDYVRQAALGLQHAHERGLVHRDIKPHNLLVSVGGVSGGVSVGGVSGGGVSENTQPTSFSRPVVKILDMGLARLDQSSNEEATGTMTREGAVMGTLDYIAPEQAVDSHKVDIRADLYSLGCTFYFLLTGQAPFAGGELLEKLAKHRWEEPAPVEELRKDLPAGVAKVVHVLMAKKPAERFQTPGELARVLESWNGKDLVVPEHYRQPTPAEKGSSAAVLAATPAGLCATVAFDSPPQSRPEESAAPGATTVLPTPLKNRRRKLLYAGSAGIVAGMILAAVFFVRSSGSKPSTAKNDSLNPSPRTAAKPALKEIANSIGMKMVLIPAGRFRMGSPDSEAGHASNEGPHYEVEITQPFYMGVTEVTHKQYQEVMGGNPSARSAATAAVEGVSWVEAVEFCKRLSDRPAEEKAGRLYRLPTEAEWEYACRAGTKTAYYFGDNPKDLERHGWFIHNARNQPPAVGQLEPNAWGLHDMAGGVWEWCNDYYEDGYIKGRSPKDPRGPPNGSRRVLRGGGWKDLERVCRSANRQHQSPDAHVPAVGFRVVCAEHASKALFNTLDMKLVLIQPGTFLMGAPEGEENVDKRLEVPQHPVKISKPFYLGAHEVTQEQFEKVMGQNPSHFTGAKRLPVDSVTWEMANEFCKKLSAVPAEKQARRVYRLPTEAEWEYACRAGTTTPFAFGETLSATQANFQGEYPYGDAPKGPFLKRTVIVGSHAPNAWGLYDMHGNVFEWCLGIGGYAATLQTDPRGSHRTLRGGVWSAHGSRCRSAARELALPGSHPQRAGIRVLCEVNGTP